jgi:hypothetical protein
MNAQAPAPTPPWLRPVQSFAVQNCFGDDAIDLGMDVTYLMQTSPKSDNSPYRLTLPNGNYQRQFKRVYVHSSTAANTAPFLLVGAFVGFASLIFNNTAFSAVLEWDGGAWQFAGGNAQPSSQT